jgi:hypothetical protein
MTKEITQIHKQVGNSLLLTLEKASKGDSKHAATVKQIILGFENPIRTTDEQFVVDTLTFVLPLCAELYCGVKKTEFNYATLEECSLFIYDHFYNLGVNEIKQAFELCAANKIENVNMTAYYGKFTVAMLGDILTAYTKYRNNEYLKIKDLHQKNLRGETFVNEVDHKNFIARQEVIAEFKAELDKKKNGLPLKYNSHEEIRIHWPKILIDNGIIQLDDETKKRIWSEAQHLVKREHQKKAADFTNLYEAKHNRALLKSFEDAGNETFQAKCEAMYSKLFVWEFLKP